MKTIKTLTVALCLIACIMLNSCATIFGGRVSECQRTKPQQGQPTRQVRVAALVLDILIFWPGAVIDFADNAIYAPCNTPASPPPAKK